MAQASLRAKIEHERDRLLAQARDLERTLDVIGMFESAASSNGNGHGPRVASVATAADETAAPVKRRRKRRKMTAAERKALGIRMKKYWAERRRQGRAGRGAGASANV
jgi:hypothetical protein